MSYPKIPQEAVMSEYTAVPISPADRRAQAQMDALLEAEGISRDSNLSYSAAIYDENGRMIATGSLFENTLRCMAVSGVKSGPSRISRICANPIPSRR